MKITCPRCNTDYDIEPPKESTHVECEECKLKFNVEPPPTPEPEPNSLNMSLNGAGGFRAAESKDNERQTIQKVQIEHVVKVTVKDLDISMGQMIWLTMKAIPAIFIGGLLLWFCFYFLVVVIGVNLF